jgi:hypothetical protein
VARPARSRLPVPRAAASESSRSESLPGARRRIMMLHRLARPGALMIPGSPGSESLVIPPSPGLPPAADSAAPRLGAARRQLTRRGSSGASPSWYLALSRWARVLRDSDVSLTAARVSLGWHCGRPLRRPPGVTVTLPVRPRTRSLASFFRVTVGRARRRRPPAWRGQYRRADSEY